MNNRKRLASFLESFSHSFDQLNAYKRYVRHSSFLVHDKEPTMAFDLEFVVISLIVEGSILEGLHRHVDGACGACKQVIGPNIHSFVLQELQLVDVASSEEAV